MPGVSTATPQGIVVVVVKYEQAGSIDGRTPGYLRRHRQIGQAGSLDGKTPGLDLAEDLS